MGALAVWIFAEHTAEKRLDRLVAVSWGDGKYGPAFYGAYVYLVPEGDHYSVQARVQVSRGGSVFHDCGELGKARSDREAVARFGAIIWRPDGLHIGAPEASPEAQGPHANSEFFLARALLENHR